MTGPRGGGAGGTLAGPSHRTLPCAICGHAKPPGAKPGDRCRVNIGRYSHGFPVDLSAVCGCECSWPVEPTEPF